jgi:plastocyanin
MRMLRGLMVCLAVAGAMLAACGTDDPGKGSPAATTAAPTVTATSPAGTAATPAPTDPATTVPAVDPSTSETASDSTDVAPESTVAERPIEDGATRMHFEIGPITIEPGQNNIAYSKGQIPKPEVDGFIVRIAPNLRFEDGSIPGVDVVHLHHGVWLNVSANDSTTPGLPERFFAAGEEKTTMALPTGYGYAFHASDQWIINYMIHNLYPIERQVWITYDIDFIPADSPSATGMVPARPVWTDVQNGSVYPVFDVIKGSGTDGTYTYPDQADHPYGTGPVLNQWTVDRDGVFLVTAGHLHPGGLHNDLWLTRGGITTHLFQSVANYYEPAGAVSWDVSMTATPEDWRVQVKAGDVLSTTATYDSARASWYESMGIMVVWMADSQLPGEAPAPDPFTTPVDVVGQLTHGHLHENDNHGGASDATYLNLVLAPSEPAQPTIGIEGYIYAQGDMLAGDAVPTIAPGGSIEFNNIDAPANNGVWHTITACKAPCNASTGIAYPLADAEIPFDSGELGAVGPPTAGRVTWSTPTDLPPGTYTYFCRIHPSMRGAFRVEDQ